jgi:glycosyltransferase involved in cell wall biosynthesis
VKIGIIVPGFSSSESDWCIPPLLSLVRELSRSHGVRVFALRYPFVRACYAVYGARVEAFGGADARGLARPPLLARAVAAIFREHRKEPFDVLHGIWADEPGYVAVRAARSLEIPSVVTLLGGEMVSIPEIGYGGRRSLLNRFLAGRALRGASAVTAGSTSLAAVARPGAEPMILPIGVDLERFTPGEAVPSLLLGEPRLLHVASLVPVKDQRTLLQAFFRVSRVLPSAGLNVVGSGPLERELRTLARELGIEGKVRFHGAVPHSELPYYYRSADLALLSSLHEGQGWATLEAAACGKTTVGTRVGLVADLVPATIAVSPRDPEALASGILEALSDRARLSERGAQARAQVVSRYSLSGTLMALDGLYTTLSQQWGKALGTGGLAERRAGPSPPDSKEVSMTPEEPGQTDTRALEIAISEKVFSRLKTQMLAVYVVSFVLAAALAWSLTWQYRALSDLASSRISEYQMLVAQGLEELHRLDLKEAAFRTRPVRACDSPLPAEDAQAILDRELSRPAEPGEARMLLAHAESFGVCDIGEVEHIFSDEVNMAKVDTVYRLLLGRPADPVGRFIYGYWLASGIGVEAVGRDIMTSPEFASLKKLSVEP